MTDRTICGSGPRSISVRTSPRSAGQALVEIFFVILVFMFVGMMAYETGVMYYNVNQINNALKQAVWAASLGATDEEIIDTITNTDTSLLQSVFFDHYITNFAIEVWVQNQAGEFDIAPTAGDALLSPGTFNAATARRAAYLWRAQGLNIRLGLNYVAGYVSPYFGATPVFKIDLPLSASQPIIDRNDEDHDGLVDLYEPEMFASVLNLPWIPFCHADSGANAVSDPYAYDRDQDNIPDTVEAGYGMYDFDNDGILDVYDPGAGQNRLRHPRLGGNPVAWP
jgi:Flp pilus assembly protein TadG